MEEIWKPMNGYEGLYEISNYGNIKSFRTRGGRLTAGELMQPRLSRNGYLRVGLRNGNDLATEQIHILAWNLPLLVLITPVGKFLTVNFLVLFCL